MVTALILSHAIEYNFRINFSSYFPGMLLSILIPARNEEENISETVTTIFTSLEQHQIPHEIWVIDDHSTDGTFPLLQELQKRVGTLQAIENTGNAGFGYSIRLGLEKYTGDCVAIVMGDLSDSPDDLVKFYHKLQEGYDAVFGSRFIRGGKTINYPWLKMRINRLANGIVRLCFGIRYNDTTNAFKLYKRETINGLKPLLSPHFNITLELPLKVIVRGYSYAVLPNTWTNRKAGQSKLKIREMGSRYFFILLYCLIERFFSKGDFRKKVELRNYEKKGI